MHITYFKPQSSAIIYNLYFEFTTAYRSDSS